MPIFRARSASAVQIQLHADALEAGQADPTIRPFAEYRRLEVEDEGMPADQARGYGLWVAKVVAARKFGRESIDRAAAHTLWTAQVGGEIRSEVSECSPALVRRAA